MSDKTVEAVERAQGLAQDLQAYADGCVEARYWGGPTMYPAHPINEDRARHDAKALAALLSEITRLQEEVKGLRTSAARWDALMRVGKIKMQGSAGVHPVTHERNGNRIHFGAEFWPDPPKPEYRDMDGGEQSTAWGKACLTALADTVLETEALEAAVRSGVAAGVTS